LKDFSEKLLFVFLLYPDVLPNSRDWYYSVISSINPMRQALCSMLLTQICLTDHFILF